MMKNSTSWVITGLLLLVTVVFVGILVVTAPQQYGAVTDVNMYSGAGQIQASGFGGSNGATALLIYYTETISVQGGHEFTGQVTCDAYPIGSEIPIQWNFGGYQIDAYSSSLLPGCAVISR